MAWFSTTFPMDCGKKDWNRKVFCKKRLTGREGLIYNESLQGCIEANTVFFPAEKPFARKCKRIPRWNGGKKIMKRTYQPKKGIGRWSMASAKEWPIETAARFLPAAGQRAESSWPINCSYYVLLLQAKQQHIFCMPLKAKGSFWLTIFHWIEIQISAAYICGENRLLILRWWPM